MSLLLQCCLDTAQVVECSCKLAGETNPCDVDMATTICNAIVAVTTILVAGFLLLKLMEHVAKGCQERRQRKWDGKERIIKQKAVLLDKKLEVLKETPKDCLTAINEAMNEYIIKKDD